MQMTPCTNARDAIASKNYDYDRLFCNFGIIAVSVAIALHQISSRCLMFDEQMMVTEYFPVRKGYNLCKVMLNICQRYNIHKPLV